MLKKEVLMREIPIERFNWKNSRPRDKKLKNGELSLRGVSDKIPLFEKFCESGQNRKFLNFGNFGNF